MVFSQRSAFVPFSLNGGRDGLRQQVSAAPSCLGGSPASSEYLLLVPRFWCPAEGGWHLEPLVAAPSLSLSLAFLFSLPSSLLPPSRSLSFFLPGIGVVATTLRR